MIEICKIFEIHEINNYIKYNKFYFLKKKILCRFGQTSIRKFRNNWILLYLDILECGCRYILEFYYGTSIYFISRIPRAFKLKLSSKSLIAF